MYAVFFCFVSRKQSKFSANSKSQGVQNLTKCPFSPPWPLFFPSYQLGLIISDLRAEMSSSRVDFLCLEMGVNFGETGP